jgi:hypothetical protein
MEAQTNTRNVWNVRVQGLTAADALASSRYTVAVAGTSASLEQACKHAVDPDPSLAAPYLSSLSTLPASAQLYLPLMLNPLLAALSQLDHPNAGQIEEALISLLIQHVTSLEGLNGISQISRTWTESFSQATEKRILCLSKAQDSLRTMYADLQCRPDNSPKALQLVLTRAFESPPLRAAAAIAIESNLRDATPHLADQRRALAGTILQTLRHIPDYADLRRLASIVFTAGRVDNAPTKTSGAQEFSYAAHPTPLSEGITILLDKLSGTDASSHAERLTPHDFQRIRQLKGLSLETFRCVTERIRLRATAEPWARAALLDLARAPHTQEVTTSIRASALGSLLSETRRLGRLTAQIEQEIFAVSAQIPGLALENSCDDNTI